MNQLSSILFISLGKYSSCSGDLEEFPLDSCFGGLLH